MLLVNNSKAFDKESLDKTDALSLAAQSDFRWTSQQWREAGGALLERLGAFASGRRSVMLPSEAVCIVHLCGEMGDVRLYPILCKLIAEDPGIADWLDDSVTETLPGVLINVFDGDAALLRRAIESAAGDPFARASALAALAYLVRAKGAMTDAAMRGFLRRIRIGALPRYESILWMSWAMVAADLGYASMRSEVAEIGEAGFIPDGDFRVEDFDLRIGLARSDPSGLASFTGDLIAPFDGASALLWTAGSA